MDVDPVTDADVDESEFPTFDVCVVTCYEVVPVILSGTTSFFLSPLGDRHRRLSPIASVRSMGLVKTLYSRAAGCQVEPSGVPLFPNPPSGGT